MADTRRASAPIGAGRIGARVGAAVVAVALWVASPASGAAPPGASERAPTVFAPAWDALVGRWIGIDDGRPGTASGATSFEYELDGRVLTRRNVVDYPGSNGRAGVHHEDLMTIHPAPDGRDAEAMYYDNEGHVIHYAATWSSDEHVLVMLSLPDAGAPRFKLTFTFEQFDRLAVVFEIAPPGSVEFRRYVGGTMRRAVAH